MQITHHLSIQIFVTIVIVGKLGLQAFFTQKTRFQPQKTL